MQKGPAVIRKIIWLPLLLCFGCPDYAAGEVCYPLVGCFNTEPPWVWFSTERQALTPEHPEKICTFMYYHSRTTEGIKFNIFPTIEVDKVPVDIAKPVFVLIHGYLEMGTKDWVLQLKNVLLNRLDANIYVADYSLGGFIPYPQAVGNARVVAKLVLLMLEASRISPSNVHIMGHSLGSQIAAYVGQLVIEKGEKIKRITALDPAGPGFEGMEENLRLDATDAELVVVLHTNAGRLPNLGMISPCGHLDFYFNGGTNQPGCYFTPVCSHQRSTMFMAEALNSTCMRGRPADFSNTTPGVMGFGQGLVVPKKVDCSDNICPPVGLEADQYEVRGVFSVTTRASSPYCEPTVG